MRAEEVIRMKRRQFITLLGSTAAWPVAAALAEVSHQRPLVGFLSPGAENFTMSHTRCAIRRANVRGNAKERRNGACG